MNYVIAIVVGLALLFLGRKLYWLFVGAVGFLFGMQLGATWFSSQEEWMVLICALLVGVVGAILAILFQRVMVGIAGFFAGGQLALALMNSLGHSPRDTISVVAFFAGAILAAIVFMLLLDWALILVSCLLGAATITQVLGQPPSIHLIAFAVLFAAGLIVQIMGMKQPTLRHAT